MIHFLTITTTAGTRVAVPVNRIDSITDEGDDRVLYELGATSHYHVTESLDELVHEIHCVQRR